MTGIKPSGPRHVKRRRQKERDAASQRQAKHRQPAIDQQRDGQHGAGEADEDQPRRDEADMRLGHAPVATGIRMDEPIENHTQHL